MRGSRVALLAVAVVVVVAATAIAVLRDTDPAPDPAGFCTRLERLARNDPFAAFGDRASEAQIEQAFDALVARADELVDLAPAEARAAAREYQQGATGLRDLLSEANGDPAEVDPRPYREQQVRYSGAAALLERYLDNEC